MQPPPSPVFAPRCSIQHVRTDRSATAAALHCLECTSAILAARYSAVSVCIQEPFIRRSSSPSIHRHLFIAVYLTTRRGVVVIAVLSTSFASTPNGECSTNTHSKTFTNATCTRLRSATRAGASTLSRKFSRGSTRFSGNASHSIPRTR